MNETSVSQSQRRDSRESLGSSDNEDSRSPTSQNMSPRSLDDDDEVSRDSLSEFSSIRLDGIDQDSQDALGKMVSSSVPNQYFLNNTLNRKREANDESLDPSTRKRTFSNAGTLHQGANGEKRTATKICRVCGDKAYSYNFNVITCESCKAFFRRNANKEKEIRCPFNENCDINIVSRRFCQRCRLQKCFKVGMKKEWIMSDEARLEKKQRIQDNRERRMAEKTHEDRAELTNAAPPSISLSNVQSNTIPQAVLPAQVMVLPPVQATSEPTLAQTVLHAHQVQNAHLLAAAAASAQADVNHQIAAAVAATQPATLLVSNNMVDPLPNPVNQTNYNTTPQQIVQAHQNQMAQVQQAAQAVQALQQQAHIEQMQQQAVHQMVAHQQQAAAHQAAQQIVAHQQQQQQVQLAAAVAAAATVMGANNPGSVMNAQTAADIVQQQAVAVLQAAATVPQSQLTPGALNNSPVLNSAAVINNNAVINTQSVLNNQSPLIPIPHPQAPLVNQITGSPPSLPTINEAVAAVAPPPTTSNELIAVPKNLLIKLVEQNIEVNQASHNPPLKCNCRCQCGRYPNDILIVDKVMADLLEGGSIEAKHELMENSSDRHLNHEYNQLEDEDRAVINEVFQSNLFWASDHSMDAGSATDVALRRLIRMMGGLHAFRRLSKNDQTIILKHGCTSHFAIRSSMTMSDSALQQNSLISNTVIQFYNSLREEWRSNETIMLLLSVIVMFDPDAPGLENRNLVQLQNSKCTRALKRILFTLCGNNIEQCKNEFLDVNNKVSILKCLNDVSLSQASTSSGNISVCSWSDEVVEPLLYKELYEPNQIMDINVH